MSYDYRMNHWQTRARVRHEFAHMLHDIRTTVARYLQDTRMMFAQ